MANGYMASGFSCSSGAQIDPSWHVLVLTQPRPMVGKKLAKSFLFNCSSMKQVLICDDFANSHFSIIAF
jgi:hypothetical protein